MIVYAGKDTEEREHSSIAGGSANVQLLWNQYDNFFRKLEISLPQGPVIPLLDIYPKDTEPYYKYNVTTMFIAALIVIART